MPFSRSIGMMVRAELAAIGTSESGAFAWSLSAR